LNHRSIALLGVAICFYIVGKPIFGVISNSIPMLIGWSGLVVGLFIGIMPKREEALLYVSTVGYETFDLIINLPQLQIEANTAFDGVKIISLIEDVPRESYQVNGLIVILLNILTVIMGLTMIIVIYKIIKKLIQYFKEQPVLTSLLLTSWTPFIYMYFRMNKFLGGDLVTNLEHGKIIFMEFMLVMGIWFIIFSPLYGYLLFKWLGIYKRIPQIS